eukprot:XP_001709820.1 Hypothetical protein GL50803_86908 [Giardia lamblia ATCC 50803]
MTPYKKLAGPEFTSVCSEQREGQRPQDPALRRPQQREVPPQGRSPSLRWRLQSSPRRPFAPHRRRA